MIIIQHTYTAHTEVIFDQDFRMPLVGTMDDIAECVCDEMVKHKFHHADVCDAGTGEVLMIIDRSLQAPVFSSAGARALVLRTGRVCAWCRLHKKMIKILVDLPIDFCARICYTIIVPRGRGKDGGGRRRGEPRQS